MNDFSRALLLHDYDQVFVVDGESRRYFSLASPERGAAFIPPEGAYAEAVALMAERYLVPEERERFLEEAAFERVAERLKRGESTVLRYRIRVDGGECRYRSLKYVPGGDGRHFIVALRDETQSAMGHIRDAHELALRNSCIHFMVANLCENFMIVDVRTGLSSTVAAAGNGALQPQESYRDQIRWFADNVVVPEERDAYLRHFELSALVAHIRESGGTASTFCTVRYADGPHELLIRSTLVRDAEGLSGEYVLLFAQDITSIRRIEEANRKLIARSRRDKLTGLLNRDATEKVITAFLNGCGEEATYCFLLLDLDYFKSINDQFGHPSGDRVLRHMGRSMRQSFRAGDILCRWGGDEFVIFLRDVPNEEVVLRRLDGLRARMCACAPGSVPVTLSIGGAFGRGSTSLPGLYRTADEALYEVKQRGRNGTVLKKVPCGFRLPG